MFKSYARKDRLIIMASCSGGHNDFTKALVKAKSIFGYVVGSVEKDGVGFTESRIAWSILYRELIANNLTRSTMKTAIRKINHALEGDSVYRRWEEDRQVYLRFSGRSTEANDGRANAC